MPCYFECIVKSRKMMNMFTCTCMLSMLFDMDMNEVVYVMIKWWLRYLEWTLGSLNSKCVFCMNEWKRDLTKKGEKCTFLMEAQYYRSTEHEPRFNHSCPEIGTSTQNVDQRMLGRWAINRAPQRLFTRTPDQNDWFWIYRPRLFDPWSVDRAPPNTIHRSSQSRDQGLLVDRRSTEELLSCDRSCLNQWSVNRSPWGPE